MHCDGGRVTGVTGKLKGGRFYGVRLTMQRVRYSLVMKGTRALEGCNKDSYIENSRWTLTR